MPVLGVFAGSTKGPVTAPTIGTATAGDGSASVTFTAPSFSKLPITSYTVTSSPGSITGTGASSPITVSGLTNGTSYTFTVVAANANGSSAASSASNSVTPAVVYYVGYGGGNIPHARDNTLDSSGNSYFVTLDSIAGGMYTAKVSSAGNFVWQKSLVNGAAYDEQGNGVAVDSSGNVFMAGYVSSSQTMITAKYNSSGTIQWQKRLQISGGVASGSKAVTDTSGNVYVGGTFYESSLGLNIAGVVKYDSSGTFVWSRYFAEAPGSSFTGIGIDSSDNIYISYGISNYGYVVKYNSSGSYQWGVRTDTNALYGGTLAVDSSGNSYLYGNTYTSRYVPFIMKINSSGVRQWERQLDAGSTATPTGVAADNSGNVYIIAYYYSGGTRSNFPIIAKYNSSGTIQWQRSFDSTFDDKDFVISVSSAGVIYINGNSDAARHLFLKLPTDGSKTGNYTINGTVFTYAASTWTDSTPALGLSARTPTYNGALSGLSHSTSSLTDGSRSYTTSIQTI